MSWQNIPLKDRTDFRDPAELRPQRLFAFELRRWEAQLEPSASISAECLRWQELPRFSAGQSSNTIAHFALDFSRKESVVWWSQLAVRSRDLPAHQPAIQSSQKPHQRGQGRDERDEQDEQASDRRRHPERKIVPQERPCRGPKMRQLFSVEREGSRY